MSSKAIDMAGKKIGRLSVIERAGKDSGGNILWKCLCECGNEKLVAGCFLRNGDTVSCGCYHKEQAREQQYRHGMATSYPKKKRNNTKLYSIWSNMKDRCFNPNNKAYKYYGGKGVRVCKEWKEDFIPFMNWAKNNGYEEGLSIDRIDNDGNYCPENCQWITRAENSRKVQINEIRKKMRKIA